MLRHDFETIYQMEMPLKMRTNSLQMFDVVTKASSTTERRLMIDMDAAPESYNLEEISNIRLIMSKHNIADGLTKENPNEALQDLLRTGFDRNLVQQFIVITQANYFFKTGECKH